MIDVAAEFRRLSALPMADLKSEYQRLWGEPTRSNNRPFLVKRCVWRAQALEQGDLSERARALAADLAREADLRIRPPRDVHDAFRRSPPLAPSAPPLPPIGTVFARRYKGRVHRVVVTEGGVEFEGRTFGSFTAVAQHITKSNINGRLFFGLTERRRGREAPR